MLILDHGKYQGGDAIDYEAHELDKGVINNAPLHSPRS